MIAAGNSFFLNQGKLLGPHDRLIVFWARAMNFTKKWIAGT
jgi:hypothetical protein